jgi:cytochrome P450
MLSVLLGGRWLPLPRLGRAAAAVDAIVLEEIAERRRRPDMRSDDCLTMFLELGEAEEDPPSDAYLARSMRGLMLAGYETTAVTLGWLAELLAAHPAELDALSASIDRGEDAYLDAVIAEVMRLRPAVPATGRRALREYDLGGLRIPRGTMILISIMALHERADVYPEPLRFRPERFLDRRPGTYTWLPYGGGAHRCLGGSFALFEARVLMRTLLAHRRLRAGGQNRGRPTTTHPMLVPAGGARVVLEPR